MDFTHVQEEDILTRTKRIILETLLKKGIEQKDITTLSHVAKHDIPFELVVEMLKTFNYETDIEWKYLTTLKLMWISNSFNETHVTYLRKNIGYNCTRNYLSIPNIPDPIEFSEHFFKSPEFFAYYNSSKFMTYCNNILTIFWEQKMGTFENIVLSIINFYLDPPNLFKSQPFMRNNNFQILQLVSAVTEIIGVFFLIVGDMFKQFGIKKKITYPKMITWVFENNGNPIEQTINKYLSDHPEIKLETGVQGKVLKIKNDTYNNLVRETYHIKTMIGAIIKCYHMDEMLDLIKSLDRTNRYPMTTEQLIPIVVYDFIVGHNMYQFIKLF